MNHLERNFRIQFDSNGHQKSAEQYKKDVKTKPWKTEFQGKKIR